MARCILIFMLTPAILILLSVHVRADVVGWHWYNVPFTLKNKKKQDALLLRDFNRLTPIEQLKILQTATTSLKDRAVLSGKVSDIAAYKKAQDFWMTKATHFTVGWEKMLLQHPELNYALMHSHENALAPILQREQHAKEDQAVLALAHSNGLLFFYRGKNKGDLLFSKTVSHYAKRQHIALIPISVDGVLSRAFKNSRQTQGLEKAHALNIHYFPTLVLVNPITHQHEIVGYGFKSEDEISDRLLKVADGWKSDF